VIDDEDVHPLFPRVEPETKLLANCGHNRERLGELPRGCWARRNGVLKAKVEAPRKACVVDDRSVNVDLQVRDKPADQFAAAGKVR